MHCMQFPFMHLSANEIDLKFQYRYADQVCVPILNFFLLWLILLCLATVPQGNSSSIQRSDRSQATCDTSIQTGRGCQGVPRRC